MRIVDHRLEGVPQKESPNCDERTDPARISLIVIHNISLPAGHFGGPYIEALFRNELDPMVHADFAELQDLRVSSHLLLRRDGAMIQFVPFDRRAWHAGESTYEGVSGCNDYSVGIELEGTDDTPYNSRQYRELAAVCRLLIDHYPLMNETRIVGHSDIAPGRKSDPGPAFDWGRLAGLLREA